MERQEALADHNAGCVYGAKAGLSFLLNFITCYDNSNLKSLKPAVKYFLRPELKVSNLKITLSLPIKMRY